MTAPGIQKVWLLPYGDLFDLQYPNNNLSFIENFQVSSIPVTVNPIRSESVYTGSLIKDLERNTHSFEHILSISINALSSSLRQEIQKIIHLPLTIIFKDSNSRYWVMGQEGPCKAFEQEAGTNDSLYSVSFRNIHKENIKEIKPFDTECISGLSGELIFQTTFVWDANLIDSNVFMTLTNGPDTYNSGTGVNPFTWTQGVPNADWTTFNNMLIGDGQVYDMYLDSSTGVDLAYIVIWSDRFFNTLSFDTSTIQGATRQLYNLSMTLGSVVQNANISVSDTNGLVYSGISTDVVNVTGITGTVANAIIDVQTLYPNGTVFTVSIPDIANCPTRTLVFDYNPTVNCNFTTGYTLASGRRYTVSFDKLGNPEYRHTAFNFNGYEFHLYSSFNDYHSDFTQLQTDLLNNLSAVSTIDANSISITEDSTSVTVTFDATVVTDLFYVITYGTSDNNGVYSNLFMGTKSNLVVIDTVSSPGIITINDSTASLSAQGTIGNPPTTNNFPSEIVPSLNTGNIDSFAFNLNGTSELTSYEVTRTASTCNTEIGTISIQDCGNGINQTYSRNIYRITFTLPVSSISITTNTGTFPLAIPALSLDMIDQLSNELKSIGIDVISVSYDLESIYVTISTDSTVTLTSVTNGTFTSTQLASFELAPLHPSQTASYTIPTQYADSSTAVSVNTLDTSLNAFKTNEINFLTGTYSSPDISFTSALTGSITVSFYTQSPQVDTPVLSYTFTATDTFDIDNDLNNIGLSPSDLTHIRVRYNDFEYWSIFTIDPTIKVDIPVIEPVLYGYHNKFSVFNDDADNMIIGFSVTGVFCTFDPNDFNPQLWIATDDINPVFELLAGTTANLVNASNSFTTSTSNALRAGEIVSFDGGMITYQVATVSGTTVTLTSIVSEGTGNYDIYIQQLITWPDKSLNNRTITMGGPIHRILQNRLNAYPGIIIPQGTYADVSPIFQASMSNLTVLAVFRNVSGTSGGTSRIYSHRDGSVGAFTLAYAATGQGSSSVVDDLGTARNTNGIMGQSAAFTFYHWTYRLVGSAAFLSYLKTSSNGTVPFQQTNVQHLSGTVTANNTTLFSDFTGTYQNGWGGEMVEMLVFSELTDAQIRTIEGYLAWKYNLQGLLPATHPFKFFAP